MEYLMIFFGTTVGIYFLIFEKKKIEKAVENKNEEKIKTKEDYEKEEMKEFLSEHVYKNKEMQFVASEKKSNGFYYEYKNYGVTVFENKKNKTIQVIKIKPYENVMNVFLKNGSTIDMDMQVNNKYEEYKYMMKIMIDRINKIELKKINKKENDIEIKEKADEINGMIKKIKEYGENNKRIEEIEKVDVPYYLRRYEHLKVYELGEGKEKILDSLDGIKLELEKMWQDYVEKKKEEYERLSLFKG